VDVDNRQGYQREPLVQGPLADLREQLEAGFTLRAALMDEGDTSRSSSQVKGEIVTGLLRSCQCFGGVAQGAP
jgi:hypothetical protein